MVLFWFGQFRVSRLKWTPTRKMQNSHKWKMQNSRKKDLIITCSDKLQVFLIIIDSCNCYFQKQVNLKINLFLTNSIISIAKRAVGQCPDHHLQLFTRPPHIFYCHYFHHDVLLCFWLFNYFKGQMHICLAIYDCQFKGMQRQQSHVQYAFFMIINAN